VEANALEEKKALANGFRDDGIFFVGYTDEIFYSIANDIVAETTGVPIRNIRRWKRRETSKK
jgi:hypothetical protein